MRKFAFSLEKALRARSWTEEAARHELGRAIGEKTAIEAALISVAEQRDAAMAERFSPSAGLQVYESWLLRLDAQRQTLLAQAIKADARIEAAREVWMAAKAELQTMENLKDRQFQTYRKEQNAKEEKELDDLHNAKPAKQGTP